MKQGFGFAKRCAAMVSAVAMLVSGMRFGTVGKVSASRPEYTVTAAQLISENYDALSSGEKALLSSGWITGDSFTYDVPNDSDGLVVIDTDAKTIRAENYISQGQTWKPTAVQLYDNAGTKVEDVTLTDGTGSYTYGKTAFTAKVTYQLSISVDTGIQSDVLTAMSGLAHMKKAADSVYSSQDSLDIVATAMDMLVQLRNGISYTIASGIEGIIQMDTEEAKAAVDALNAQCKANGGKLDLQPCNEAYAAAPMAYLSAQGTAYQEKAAQTYGNLKAIAGDSVFNNSMIDSLIKNYVPGMSSAWNTLKTELKKAVVALEPAAQIWTGSVPQGLTSEEYTTLETLVNAVAAQDQITAADDLALTEALLADTTEVSCNASMVDVKLRVVLQVYDENNRLTDVTKEQVVKLEEGASIGAVEAAADALEQTALESFAAQGYDVSCFERSVETNIGSDLADVTEAAYAIVYTPKQYDVTFAYDGTTVAYDYSYRLTLEAYPGEELVYEYSIDGTAYAQNAVYVVVGPVTVQRVTGKVPVQSDILSIIANSYATDKEAAILTSGALLGNESLMIRYPDNDDGKLVVPEDSKLTVNTFNSGYKNMHWLPYSYTVNGQTKYFDGNSSVVISASGVDTIPVVYRLTLTDVSAERTQAWLDTVAAMANDADAQRNALEKLNAQYSNMGQIRKAMLNVLKDSIYETELHEDWETNEELQDYLVEVVGNIIDDCMDTNGRLRIYNMLTEYRKEGGGLVYYYRNSEEFIAEVKLLSGYLSDMLADELKINAVKILMENFGYSQYADRFTELEGIMAEVSAALTPPNAAIDVNSQNLDVLVQALTMSGSVGTTGVQSPYVETTFAVAAPNKSTVRISIMIGSREVGAVSQVYEISENYVLTQADVDSFKAQIAAIVAQNVDARFYTETIDVALESLVGRVMDSSVAVKNVFTPIKYTVHIDGADSQTVTVEDPVITLPTPPVGMRYDFAIDGKTVSAASYRFTTEQLERLFADGSYTISCNRVDEAAERLATFLAELNEAGGDVMHFSLNEAQDTLTVEVAAADKNALYAKVPEVAMVMLNGYGYIGLNDQGLMYTTETGSTEICLQSIVDAILHDEQFSHQTIIGLGDGKGHLATTSVQLGQNSDRVERDLTLHIELTSVSAEMLSVANGMENVDHKLSFRANGGTLDVDMALPYNTYLSVLTGMMLTGEADLSDLNSVTGGEVFAFNYQFTQYMLSDKSITLTTYENTLRHMGTEVDMSGNEGYYLYIADVIRNSTTEQTADGAMMHNTVAVKPLIDEAAGDSANAALFGMIKEYNTDGIVMDMNITMATETGFEAVILDPGAENLSDSFRYTKDLRTSLQTLPQGAVVILLADIQGSLVVTNDAVLDLNGYSVTGGIAADNSLAIVDSSPDTFACGEVGGSLSGDITVYGGSFASDVTSCLPEGFVQDGSVVRDERFSVSEAADGSLAYTVYTDTSIRSQELAADLMADALLRSMRVAMLQVDGKLIYDLSRWELKDGADLSSRILLALDSQGLGNTVSTVLEALNNFSAAASGKNVYACTLSSTPWAVEINHVAEGDYLTFALVTGTEVSETKLSMTYGGEHAAAQMEHLSTIVTGAEFDVSYSQPTVKADGSVTIQGTGTSALEINLAAKEEYGTILAVILAYSRENLRAGVAAAINTSDMQDLQNILDGVTVNQLLQAMQSMKPGVNFAAMAKAVGVTVDMTAEAKIEDSFHSLLCSFGDELDSWTVTGGDKTLGSMKNAKEPGSYTIQGLSFSRKTVTQVGATAVESTMQWTNVTVHLAGMQKIALYDVLDTSGKVVLSTDSADSALAAVKEGYTLRINRSASLGYWDIKGFYKVENAHNIQVGGFTLNVGGKLQADGPVNVYTAATGYIVKCTQSGGQYTYALEAMEAPTCTGENIAKVWTEKKDGVTYLFVDIDPTAGMTLKQLEESLSHKQMHTADGTVKYTIAGNNGDSRIKTGDVITITLGSGSLCVAKVEYELIVSGDVNRDGRVTSGDAVAMMNIYNGNSSQFNEKQLMAADAYPDGKVTASDAVRIMTKYMDWDTYRASVK